MNSYDEKNREANPEEGIPEDDPVEAGKKAIEAARQTDRKGPTHAGDDDQKADAEKWRNEG